MPRNITAAQKRARDFHKSDALAQTNQIKYDCFFMHGTENIKKLFSQDLIRNKNPDQVFLDFILFLDLILLRLELSKEIFLSPEYLDFGFKF